MAEDAGPGAPDGAAEPGRILPDGAPPQQSSVLRVLIGGACLIIIIIGLKYAREVVNPILLAFVVALAISPLLHAMIKRGMSTTLAFIVTLIVAAIVGIMFVVIMGASLAQLAKQLPEYTDRITQIKNDVVKMLDDAGLNVNQIAGKTFSSQNIVDFAIGSIDNILGALSGAGTIALVFLFMLWDAAVSSSKYSSSQPVPLFARMDVFTREVRGFLKVQVMLGALAAIVETVVLLILGVDFALLWGLVSFLFSFIPYVGFVAALIPPAALALLGGSWVDAIIVVAAYIVINTLTDNLLKPSIMGKETNLSPLIVFLSLVIWGWALGPVGALLSVPLTLMARTLFLEGYEESQWLARLMAKTEKPERKDAGREPHARGWLLRRRGESGPDAEAPPGAVDEAAEAAGAQPAE